jgi:hypothetical protein
MAITKRQIAIKLVGGEPMDYKSYDDGSLVVIGPAGKKYKFSKEQVAQAAAPQKKTTAAKTR